MPLHQDWYCGHCGCGPLSLLIDVFCSSCHRRRDNFAVFGLPSNTWSPHHAGPSSQSEDPGVRSISAVDTESALLRAAAKGEAPSPERSSVDLSPAKPVSSEDSKALVAVGSGTLGLAPDDVLPRTVQPSSEQKAASQGASEIRQDLSVDLNKETASRIISSDKKSRLDDYLSVNPEDPWNHVWVVYSARTPLPGEASYSLETWEPARTSGRRPYSAIRRAEVAFTRNNGGACEPCRRSHRACPHRLQELAATYDDDGIASAQVVEGGVTRRAIDAVNSDVAAGVGSSPQYGGAINSEYSAGGMLFAPTPRREPSQRPHGHRRTRTGPSEPFALAPSQRPQASRPSLVLGDEPGIRRGRPRGRIGANSLGSGPARPSARHGQDINVMSWRSGSSRQSNNAAIHGTSRDFAASTPVEETYSLGDTQRGTEEPSYMYTGAGLRTLSPLPYVQQQSPLSTAPSQGTSLSHGFLPWREDSYANLGGTRARSSNVEDPPRSASRNQLDLVPAGDVDSSSSHFFRPPETPFWPSEQASFGQEYSNEQAVEIPLPMERSSLPQTHLNHELMSVLEVQEALPNRSDENRGWQIEDGSSLDAGPPEPTFGTALPDDLFAAPDQRGDHHATHLPSAIDANSQPAGLYEWIDIDLPADLAWDNLYYGWVDRSINPASGSYAAYFGDPFSTDGPENTSWSNSDPIPTPPCDETG